MQTNSFQNILGVRDKHEQLKYLCIFNMNM